MGLRGNSLHCPSLQMGQEGEKRCLFKLYCWRWLALGQ